MEYHKLGQTPFMVSRICFGALTMGPLGANLSPAEGAKVLRKALELGVNFIDTAQYYQTYPHIAAALRGWQGAEDFAFRATFAKAAVDFGAQFIKLITEFIGYFCNSCKGLFLNLHLEFRAYSSGLLIKCRSPRAQPPIIAGASGCRRCRLVQERKCCGNSN